MQAKQEKPLAPLRIGIVAPNDAQTLDVTGPVDAFTQVNRLGGGSCYKVEIIGTKEGPVTTASGVRLLPDTVIGAEIGTFDTILVAGSPDYRRSIEDRPLLDWLIEIAPKVRRLGSICNGAFLLAAAGLLSGRRATTHWQSAKQLAAMFPDTRVDPSCIFIRDGSIYTSAGVTAGIDLCLHLVEKDYGHATSLAAARALVVFLRRPGGQSQFSSYLKAQATENRQIADVLDWALEHLDSDLSVTELARRAAMSCRNFTRSFHHEFYMTPARFVEHTRVESARILLETSELPIQLIAHRCGFATANTMRRSFVRMLSVSPNDYRRRLRLEVPEERRDTVQS
jgi:transcriptional regulator GlxA family with amidase domain